MIQRIAFGALAIAFILGLVALDAFLARFPPHWAIVGDLLARGSLIPLGCLVVGLLACRELIELLTQAGLTPQRMWSLLACAALIVAPWLNSAGLLGGNPYDDTASAVQLGVLALALLVAGALQIARGASVDAARALAGTWLVIIYAGLLPSFLVMLRCDRDVPGWVGASVVLQFLAICKAADIGAYFTGMAIGRHKLAPRVSPGKSIEGLVGGLAASVAVSVVFMYLQRKVLPNDGPLGWPGLAEMGAVLAQQLSGLYRDFTLTQAIILGLVISLAGQIGDLFESLLKRSAGSKDSGNVLPGFGGVLDMVDSPWAAAPVAWWLLTQMWEVL